MAYIPNYKATPHTKPLITTKPNGSSDPFYKKNKWRIKSEQQRREYPYCASCKDKGITIFGNVADHIIPISIGGAKWDDRNLQTLCHPCHNRKRKLESQGTYQKFMLLESGEKIPAL